MYLKLRISYYDGLHVDAFLPKLGSELATVISNTGATRSGTSGTGYDLSYFRCVVAKYFSFST